MHLADCIEHLSNTYNSIDVRCASYFHNDALNSALMGTEWNSALLVIRFRRETVEELQQIHGKLLNEIGIIKNDSFRTSFHAFSIRDWDKILKNWNNNSIFLTSGYSVNIPPNSILKSDMREPTMNYADYVNDEWNVYNSSTASGQDIRTILKDQEKNARKQGFETISQYLSAFSDIPEDTIANNEKSLIIITAPVFFKMGHIIFEDKQVNIPFKGDISKRLDLTLEFYNLHPNGTPKKLIKREFIVHPPSEITNNELVEFTVDNNFEVESVDHYFKLIAYKDGLIVAKAEASVRSCFPTLNKITNPFSDVLQQFVSFDDLKKMILDFESKGSKDKGANFERGIVYLLNMLGINAVLLGKGSDTIGIDPNKISVDILGTYDGETVVIGFATIGIPSDSEFASDKMYVDNLRKINSNQNLKMFPIMFSGSPTSTLSDKAQENGMRLIGRTELETILELLSSGNIDNARGWLISDLGIPL